MAFQLPTGEPFTTDTDPVDETVINPLSMPAPKTILKLELPYIIHTSHLTLDFNWREIPIKMDIAPIFSGENSSVIKPGENAAINYNGISKWTTGHSEINLEINALINCDEISEELQGIHNIDANNDWRYCFELAYQIIRDVSLTLNLDHHSDNQWVPVPRDIEQIERWISVGPHNKKINWRQSTSPIYMVTIFYPNEQKQKFINLGNLKTPAWSKQCRNLAINAFDYGQKEEALFWLNVGVE